MPEEIVTEATPLNRSYRVTDGIRSFTRRFLEVGRTIQRPRTLDFSRRSPLDRTLLRIVYIYVFLVALTIVLLVSDVHLCYLEGEYHIVSFTNATVSMASLGLVVDPDKIVADVNETVAPVIDSFYYAKNGICVKLYNDTGTITPQDPSNPDFNPSRTPTGFPMAIILNHTRVQNADRVTGPSYVTISGSKQSGFQDNGATIYLTLSNPNRKRMFVSPPWFNYAFWSEPPDKFLATTSLANRSIATCTALNPGVVPSTLPLSNVPTWFVDLEQAGLGRVGGRVCNSDYGISLQLNPWFCVSPLFITDVALSNVTFDNVTLNGRIIVDFNLGAISEPQLAFLFTANTRITQISLLKAKEALLVRFGDQCFADFEVNLPTCDMSNKDYSLGSKTACQYEFHGVSGAKPDNNGSAKYFSMDYVLPIDLPNTINVEFEYAGVLEAKGRTLSCAVTKTGSVSTLTYTVTNAANVIVSKITFSSLNYSMQCRGDINAELIRT